MSGSAGTPPPDPAADAWEAGLLLDLRRVSYFVTVAETLSYTKAAERLHLSTSGLSQQIKALERGLRVQLLVRDSRHVDLTPAGAQLLISARVLLEANRDAVAATRLASGADWGELNLAIVTGLEASFERLMRTVQMTYPTLRLSTFMTRHDQAVQALVEGSADAVITWSYQLRDHDSIPGLRWRPVGEEEAVAVIPVGLAPVNGGPVPRGAGTRLGAPLVLFERRYAPTAYDFAIENIFGGDVGSHTVLPVRVVVRAQEAMMRTAAEVGGIAPVPRSISTNLGGRLESRPFDPPWFMEIACAWIERGETPMRLRPMLDLATAWSDTTTTSRAAHAGGP